MERQNSILDKIMESQEKQQAASFSPSDLIGQLFKNLSSKESDILSRRFGLSGKQKETLEQIGKYYEITRERIRQIETATIKKIKDLKDFRREIDAAEQHIAHLLENHGGAMEESDLLRKLTGDPAEETSHEAAKFILSKLLSDKIEPIKADEDILSGWKLPVLSLGIIKESVQELVNIIKEKNRLLKHQELLNSFKQRDFYKNKRDQIIALKLGLDEEKIDREVDSIIESYLVISKNIDQNILGEWGLNNWHTVAPKRMSDKVYLVLRKSEKPLHFTEITNLINQIKFDGKVAYPATIHNELILDDRYILVGRGIYALKEWGYKSGTVMDTIIDILKNSSGPLSKEEIVKKVLDQRIVRKSTIYLALTNKEKIKKLPDGKYTLAE